MAKRKKPQMLTLRKARISAAYGLRCRDFVTDAYGFGILSGMLLSWRGARMSPAVAENSSENRPLSPWVRTSCAKLNIARTRKSTCGSAGQFGEAFTMRPSQPSASPRCRKGCFWRSLASPGAARPHRRCTGRTGSGSGGLGRPWCGCTPCCCGLGSCPCWASVRGWVRDPR